MIVLHASAQVIIPPYFDMYSQVIGCVVQCVNVRSENEENVICCVIEIGLKSVSMTTTSWSPHQGTITKSYFSCNEELFFHVSLNKLLKIQLSCRWFETPWHSCDVCSYPTGHLERWRLVSENVFKIKMISTQKWETDRQQCIAHITMFMGPTWVLSAPDGPHVGPTNLAIRECFATAPNQ